MAFWRIVASSIAAGELRRGVDRMAAQLALVFLSATAVLLGGAMWLYPGGTWAERTRQGHLFWENFWCDLLRSEALNGAPNPFAPQLATAGMVAFALALAAYWFAVAQILGSRGVARWVLRWGCLGSLGIVLIALLPSDRFPTGHPVAILVAGPAFAGAVVAACYGLWGVGGRWRSSVLLAGLGVALALINLLQYARQVFFDAEYALWLPGLQKTATLCFVLWVAVVSGWSVRDSRRPLDSGRVP